MKRTALLGLAAIVLSCATNPATKIEKTRLEVTAFPRLGMVRPYGLFRFKVHARIKGPETEKYHCPKVTWSVGEGLDRLTATEEGDCVPFEDRHKTVYDNSPECMPRIKNYELIVPSCHVISEPQGFRRSWTKGYSVGMAGVYRVCAALSKAGKTFARRCASVAVMGGE